MVLYILIKGKCQEGLNGLNCKCFEGWSGSNCDIPSCKKYKKCLNGMKI